MEWPKGSWCSAARAGHAQQCENCPKSRATSAPLAARQVNSTRWQSCASVLWEDTVCYLHLPWFKWLVVLHHTTGRRKWAGQGGQELCRWPGHWHTWIPGDELDQFPKLGFLSLPGGRTLWTPETASPHESLWRDKWFFHLAVVFPWLRFFYAHRWFLNRFNKGLLTTHGVPESHRTCAVLEALCKMSKIRIWRAKYDFSPLLPSGCWGHMPAQHPCTGYPWDREGPFTPQDESQQQEKHLETMTTYIRMICSLQGNETGFHPLDLL